MFMAIQKTSAQHIDTTNRTQIRTMMKHMYIPHTLAYVHKSDVNRIAKQYCTHQIDQHMLDVYGTRDYTQYIVNIYQAQKQHVTVKPHFDLIGWEFLANEDALKNEYQYQIIEVNNHDDLEFFKLWHPNELPLDEPPDQLKQLTLF